SHSLGHNFLACSLVRHGFAAAAVAAISNRLRPTIAALDNSRQLKPLNDGLYIAKDGQCIAAVVLRLMAFVLVVGDTVAFLCQSQFQPTARGQ
ncbi:MAG: hypothetical protein WBX95_24075, partial [Xanthobacteraceae bacterium]